MSGFNAKMHKIRLPLGLCSRLRWGRYRTPLELLYLAVFKGPTYNGEGEEGGEGRGRGEKGKRKGRRRGKGREGRIQPPPKKNILS